jgi:hypothetical protein
VSRLSRQCGVLNISQSYGPPRPVTGIALLSYCFTFCFHLPFRPLVAAFQILSPLSNSVKLESPRRAVFVDNRMSRSSATNDDVNKALLPDCSPWNVCSLKDLLASLPQFSETVVSTCPSNGYDGCRRYSRKEKRICGEGLGSLGWHPRCGFPLLVGDPRQLVLPGALPVRSNRHVAGVR